MNRSDADFVGMFRLLYHDINVIVHRRESEQWIEARRQKGEDRWRKREL